MIGCGVSISGGEATFIWVDFPSKSVLQKAKAKVRLEDPYSQVDILHTMDLIRQLIVERKTDLVVVRRSSTSGKFPASHVAFKLEAIIAMAAPVEVRFISSQAIAAFIKKANPDIPESVLKYQQDAFCALISGLGD